MGVIHTAAAAGPFRRWRGQCSLGASTTGFTGSGRGDASAGVSMSSRPVSFPFRLWSVVP